MSRTISSALKILGVKLVLPCEAKANPSKWNSPISLTNQPIGVLSAENQQLWSEKSHVKARLKSVPASVHVFIKFSSQVGWKGTALPASERAHLRLPRWARGRQKTPSPRKTNKQTKNQGSPEGFLKPPPAEQRYGRWAQGTGRDARTGPAAELRERPAALGGPRGAAAAAGRGRGWAGELRPCPPFSIPHGGAAAVAAGLGWAEPKGAKLSWVELHGAAALFLSPRCCRAVAAMREQLKGWGGCGGSGRCRRAEWGRAEVSGTPRYFSGVTVITPRNGRVACLTILW